MNIKYKFYGFTFELPEDHELESVGLHKGDYAAHTSKATIRLKACSKCKRLLEMDRFYYGKAPCKQCHMVTVRKWQKAHPDRIAIYKRKYNRTYRETQKLKIIRSA